MASARITPGEAPQELQLDGTSDEDAQQNGSYRPLPENSSDGYQTATTDDTQPSQRPASSMPSLEELVTDSPFLDLGSPMTAYEWFKAVLLLPWAAFKFLLSVSGLALVWLVVRILVIGAKPNEPGGAWRYKLIQPWLQFWTGIFLRLGLGFWGARVTGWENYQQALQDRAICVFNHHSYVDAIAMTHFFATSGVAKAAVADLPFIGPIAVALQFLFVLRRGSHDVRNKHTQLAGKTVEKIAARAGDSRFPLLMIAPEGTTKHHNVLLRFSTGAFVPGRPVVPILLRYTHKHFNAGWGITYTFWHLYRLITQFYNTLEVEVLPVYYPSDEEVANPTLYANNVRSLMGKALGAKLVEQTFEHNIALKKNHVHVNFLGTKVVMQAS